MYEIPERDHTIFTEYKHYGIKKMKLKQCLDFLHIILIVLFNLISTLRRFNFIRSQFFCAL